MMMRAIANPLLIGRDPPHDGAPGFRDREDAGTQLAQRLNEYRGADVLVLGVPRGGVPVAAAVARALGADLDVVVARKLGSPVSPELAIGAVTADGNRFLNDAMVRDLSVSTAYIERVTKQELAEAARREERFRGGAEPARVRGRTVILVDDGLATGATMIAAARSVRARKPARLVVAVPVGSAEACAALRREADDVVCLATPDPFWAVGLYYEDFGQTQDDEVERLLAEARARAPAAASTEQMQ